MTLVDLDIKPTHYILLTTLTFVCCLIFSVDMFEMERSCLELDLARMESDKQVFSVKVSKLKRMEKYLELETMIFEFQKTCFEWEKLQFEKGESTFTMENLKIGKCH